MMSTVIVRFFQQFFNPNCNDERSNSPPKSRNEIANICVLVNRWMISPRLKSCPRILPNFHFLSRGIHCFKGVQKLPISSAIFASSSSFFPRHLVCLAAKPRKCNQAFYVSHGIMGLLRRIVNSDSKVFAVFEN